MRFAETSMNSHRPLSRRLLSLALPLLVAAVSFAGVSFTPRAARGDTPQLLPQGYATDAAKGPANEGTIFLNTQADVDVTVAVDADGYADTDPAALTDFRDPLTPYGVWVDDATYGTVWVPSSTAVGADFAPYQTSGHWELDANDDWLWVSDYDWGYIPFHYGRWVFIGGHGWSWIPGRTYAPAWVSWRMTDYGYIGWAPMAPSWYWFGGSAVTVWTSPGMAYVFCPSSYVFNRHVHTYVVRDRDIVNRIGAHSRPYRPARPTSGHGAGNARPYRPASPSLADAKIPSGSAPQKKAEADARAIAYSRRSTTSQARQMSREARTMPSSIAPSRGAQEGRAHPGQTRDERPSVRRIDTSSSRPSVQPHTGTHVQPRSNPSTPSVSPSHPSVSPSRPSVSPSRPSVSPSRPSVSPSRPSVSPSRPSVSPSRPSVSPSRPSVSPSRPSVSPSRPSSSPRRR